MNETTITIDNQPCLLPRLTLGVRRSHPSIASALRRIAEIERVYNLRDSDTIGLRKRREEDYARWVEMVDSGDTSGAEEFARRVACVDAEIARMSILNKTEDDNYLDALAGFVFEYIRLAKPDYTKEQFENDFDVPDLIGAYNSILENQKKIPKSLTPSEAFVMLACLKAMPQDTLLELAPELTGIQQSEASNRSIEPKPGEVRKGSLKEIY